MSLEHLARSIKIEQPSYNNFRFHLIVAEHNIRSKDYFRQVIDGIGGRSLHFLGRGDRFRNVFLMEEGTGKLVRVVDSFNEVAEEQHSFRSAYWHVVRQMSLADSLTLTHLFNQNPVERFYRVGRRDGISEGETGIQIFFYAALTALDDLRRKGFQIELAVECESDARGHLAAVLDSDLEYKEWFKQVSLYTMQVDIGIARQVENIALCGDGKKRVLAVFGSTHASIIDYLPRELQRNCDQVDELTPGLLVRPEVQLVNRLKKGTLTDTEIDQVIDRWLQAGSR